MKNCISLLLEDQNKEGYFEEYLGGDKIFFTALILSSLNTLENGQRLRKIKQQAAAFLLSQKDKNWIFSNDTNKNFCVLSALKEYDPELFNGDVLAKVLNLLTSLESQVGGPYFGNRKNKKIDLVSNVQISYFLSLHNVNLPNLDELINQAIINQDYKSEIYQTPYPVIYLISKFYRGVNQQKIFDYIINTKGNNCWNGGYSRLFALLSLKNFNYNKVFLVKEIDSIKRDFLNNFKQKTSLEKSLYIELVSDEKRSGQNEETERFEEEKMMKKILDLADKRFYNLEGNLKIFAKQEIEKTIIKNIDGQMSLMAYFMKKSFGKKGEIFSDEFVAELGLANIFFWNAFIIYDDFWDEEGIPKILPTANLYARDFIKYFNLILPRESGLPEFFDKLMDRLDSANTWETVYCRAQVKKNIIRIPRILPDYCDYEIAYEPASAHILGPLVMMYKLGYGLESEETKNLIQYFRNYLIAMQINDDAHDWEDDLRRGHLSIVVVMLLKDYLKIHPNNKEIDLAKDMNELKSIYWYTTLRKICVKVLEQANKSRMALEQIEVIKEKYFLDKLIISTELVANKSLEELRKTIDFLKNFNGG